MHPRLRANAVVLTCLFAGLLAGRRAVAAEARPFVSSAAAGTSDLAVYPPRIMLAPGKTHRLLVTAIAPDGFEADVTRKAKLASDHPEVVAVESGGVLRAIAAGTATVTATLDGKTTTAEVSVPAAASDNGISFINDVMPVLSRAGCNAGSCHAKPEGQNGFKLSVFAYDLKGDYRRSSRTTAAGGSSPRRRRRACCCSSRRRQVEARRRAAVPGQIPSRTGCSKWIEQGMPYSQPTDAALVGAGRLPARGAATTKAATQPLLVTARLRRRLDAGRHRPGGLRVQREGDRQGGRGRPRHAWATSAAKGVVIARFMGLVAISRITVPAERALPDSHLRVAAGEQLHRLGSSMRG